MTYIPWKKVEWTRSRDEFIQVLLIFGWILILDLRHVNSRVQGKCETRFTERFS